jgi:hypothetical protein
MTFANAVVTQKTQTTNGMTAFKNTANGVLDFFSSVGARRGSDNVPLFNRCVAEDKDLAIRALLWSRDVRGGAGERQTFRDCLVHLAKTDIQTLKKVITKVPEVGRWDDLLCLFGTVGEAFALDAIAQGIKSQNGLCAKWMPRKGDAAVKIRDFLGYTPKQYRKTLVNLTQVVEQNMCAKQFDKIELKKVPSLASIRYKNAFTKHIPEKVKVFADQVAKGEVKVNASAIYPHQITTQLRGYGSNEDQAKILQGQWDNLPNYVPEGSKVIPLVDVSGSMACSAGGSTSVQCIDISAALGLYLASKNTGAFKDLFLTFHTTPSIEKLQGNLRQRVNQVYSALWGGSTDISKAFDLILKVAKDGNVAPSDMPDTLIIFSDMQFNEADRSYTPTAHQLVKRKYEQAGYQVPKIVFWNLKDYGNKAAQKDDVGAALVSGFSPSLIKSVLSSKFEDFEKFTPYNVMLETLMQDRYTWN